MLQTRNQARIQERIGVIIGFQNQKKKRLVRGLLDNMPNEIGQIKLTKYKGFSDTNKEQLQKEIKEFVRQYAGVNSVYVVLLHDRIDKMKKKLQKIMVHFKKYLNHLFLLISAFEPLQNITNEYFQIIKSELSDYFNIKLCYLFQFSQNSEDLIYQGNSIISRKQFIQQTILQREKIKFDTKDMDLDKKQDKELLKELNQKFSQQLVEQSRDMILNKHQKAKFQLPPIIKDNKIQIRNHQSRDNKSRENSEFQQRGRSNTIEESINGTQKNHKNNSQKRTEDIKKTQIQNYNYYLYHK